MTDSTQAQQATATSSPFMEQVVDAPLEASHSQAPPPTFSFDDEPLFDVDGSAATLPDDFFSSPEWTDPSPALTTSMSFAIDSCDTSPLLTDNYDAPDLSGVPLFGDYHSHASFSTESIKRSPQNAFNGIKDVNEESAMLLLRAFSKRTSVLSEAEEEAIKQKTTVALLTASPSAISSPLPSTANHRPALSSSSSFESLANQPSSRPSQSNRSHKRRLDATDLLPMDAPIQPRTYKTPSATSRKETQEFAAEEAAIAAEKDPLVAKRLSNTLAARRSRHRKAAELRELNDTIEDLQNEVEMWKRRCLRLESERDQAR